MPTGSKNSIIKGCGTHHIAVQTRDWAASLKLYQDVLGMKLVAEFRPSEHKIVLLDTGDGSHIELFEPKTDTPAVGDPAANDPVTHFALATTDTRAALEHVRQAGYEVTVEPKDMTLGSLEVTIAFFKGPSGEIIELFQTH
jgi:glyoxylase I family protein